MGKELVPYPHLFVDKIASRPIEDIDHDRWNLIQSRVQRSRAIIAFDIFREESLEPILFKGLAASQNYPDSHFRQSLDIDLAVAPDKYDTAVRHWNWGADRTPKILIDLHCGLRHLDTVEWDDLFANSVLVDIDGTPIRMLRPEDHLRVMAVHWLNDGAANRERLWDIYYAVVNRPVDFDWDRCLNVVSQTRRTWVITAIGLAHKYLELFIDDLPFADEAKNIPNWLIRCVEKEWASEVKLLPLHMFTRDPRSFLIQVRKRIPPNPLQATIEMEAPIDNSSRIPYQIRNTARRLIPSIKRVVTNIFGLKR